MDAFSTRALTVRENMDTPTDPISLSSRESVVETCPPPLKRGHSLSSRSSSNFQNNQVYTSFKYVLDNKAIDPNGKLYIGWLSLAAMAVMYNAWVIPLRSTFPYQNAQNRFYWMSFDYLADLIYMIDMVLVQPRVKYLHEGFWVTDMRQLKQNYVKKKAFKVKPSQNTHYITDRSFFSSI